MPAAGGFHSANVGASGRKGRTIARRTDIFLLLKVHRLQPAATLRRRKVSKRAASRCPHLSNRRDASREKDMRRLTMHARIVHATIVQAGL